MKDYLGFDRESFIEELKDFRIEGESLIEDMIERLIEDEKEIKALEIENSDLKDRLDLLKEGKKTENNLLEVYGKIRKQYISFEERVKDEGTQFVPIILEIEKLSNIPEELSFFRDRKENLLSMPLPSIYYFSDDDFGIINKIMITMGRG